MAQDNRQDSADGQTWIERLPPGVRKKIWLVLTGILSLVIFFAWVGSVRNSLMITAPAAADPNLEALKSDLAAMVKDAEANLAETVEELERPPAETAATTTLTEADIRSLKEKLLGRQLADWPTYSDADAGFSLQYPAALRPATSTGGNQALLVEFRQNDRQSFKIKKYRLIEEFFSQPDLRKYFSYQGQYLAVFDTIRSTTTDLMLTSFKINQ